MSHAHQLAEHGRRTRPTIKDVIQATKEFGVGGPHQLEQEIHRVKELGQSRMKYISRLGLGRMTEPASWPLTDRPAPKVKYERRRVDRIGPLLASDDEDDRDGDDDDGHLTDEDGVGSGTKTTGHRSKSAVRRSTKREALLALEADYLPPLPAKHSYRQTPVSRSSACSRARQLSSRVVSRCSPFRLNHQRSRHRLSTPSSHCQPRQRNICRRCEPG